MTNKPTVPQIFKPEDFGAYAPNNLNANVPIFFLAQKIFELWLQEHGVVAAGTQLRSHRVNNKPPSSWTVNSLGPFVTDTHTAYLVGITKIEKDTPS